MINNVFATGHNRSKLYIIDTETKCMGISFDYIYIDYIYVYICATGLLADLPCE